MTPQELRNSILQLAIEGKLVSQNEIEGTSKNLLVTLEKTKEELINKKIAKAEKNILSTENIDEFEIPSTWNWCRLANVSYINGGYAFKSSEYKENGVRVIRISDFNEKGFKNDKIVRYDYSDDLKQYIIEEKDIILCMTGGTVGKSYFVSNISEIMVTNQRVATIKIINPVKEYINYVILSPFIQSVINESKNSTNDNISMDLINNFLIPLPPIEEQKRIVARIEELMLLVDKYEIAYNKLQSLNKQFPIDLEKSILQYAVEGKLVEHRHEDGTGEDLFKLIQQEKQQLIKEGKIKKEKELPSIQEDEIPFDIPSTWKWVRISDVFLHSAGKSLNSSDRDGNEYSYITTSNVYWNFFILDNLKKMFYKDNELEKCSCKKGDLLILEGGDIGRAAVWNFDFDMRIQNHIHRLRPIKGIIVEFFYYVFFLYKNANLIEGRGIGLQGLSANKLKSIIVPLPPIEEQKRIISKLEELLPLIKKLN